MLVRFVGYKKEMNSLRFVINQQSKPSLLNQCHQFLYPLFHLRFCSIDHTQIDIHSRRIPVQPISQKELLKKKPESISNSKSLQVAILGLPNAGKSTLVNQIVGWKTCAVSSKVHTTRKASTAVFLDENIQIVFLDTPGLVDLAETKQ